MWLCFAIKIRPEAYTLWAPRLVPRVSHLTTPGDGKMRDPGNKVGEPHRRNMKMETFTGNKWQEWCTTGTIVRSSLYSSQVIHQAKAYLQFLSNEAIRSISTAPLRGCYAIPGLPPALNLPIPIYTPGWRETLRELRALPKNTMRCIGPKNTIQCLQPGLKPGRWLLGVIALTTRPWHLCHGFNVSSKFQSFHQDYTSWC